MRTLLRAAVAAALLAVAAPPAAADPVDDAVAVARHVLCPMPDVDLCPSYEWCWVYPLLAPGVPGVVDVNAEGDVWVAGRRVVDCPPFSV